MKVLAAAINILYVERTLHFDPEPKRQQAWAMDQAWQLKALLCYVRLACWGADARETEAMCH